MRSFLLVAASALAIATMASPLAAMGERPGSIAAGTDIIPRAEFDALTARHTCALPLFTARQYAIKATFNGYYTLASEAYTKHNRAKFDTYAALVGKVISDLGLPC